MKKIILHFIWVFSVLVISCKEDLGTTEPQFSDGKGPANVSHIQVENGPGKAVLRYKIPDDIDISYVKARYEIRPGVFRETKSSKSNDSLVVDGFGSSKIYKVELTTFDKGENSSTTSIVEVNPTTPPIVEMTNTITLINDFGGMGIIVDNPSESDFTFIISEKIPSSQIEKPIKTFYTKVKKMAFNIRGYDPEPVTFVITIKDKYGNVSTPIIKEIVPLEELLLDRNNFKAVPYDNDTPPFASDRDIPTIWNNKFGDDAWHSKEGVKMPMSVTFDLGKKVKLSRFKYFQRTSSSSFIYSHYNLKRFEIYGSNNPSSDWASWELVGRYESVKPSGLPTGQLTDDDRAVASGGEEFNVLTSASEVRYLRIKMLENWSGLDGAQICEMQFWGQYK
jgi:hypothetical protein